MTTLITLEGLGIINGDEKRLLEDVVPGCEFAQRKSYDEYYVKSRSLTLDVSLPMLMRLAGAFRVIVCTASVAIERV
jgi:lipopolysaccharide/colanic/teichoic acid biosynthesis glycosyltransferase